MYERQRLKRGIRDISHLYVSRSMKPEPSPIPGSVRAASPVNGCSFGLEERPLIGLAVAPVGGMDLEIALAIGRGLSRRMESLMLVYPEHESSPATTLAQIKGHVPPAALPRSGGPHLLNLGSRLQLLIPAASLPDPLATAWPGQDHLAVKRRKFREHLRPIMVCMDNNTVDSWSRFIPVCDQLILVLPPREKDFSRVLDWLVSLGPAVRETDFYWLMAGRFTSPASMEGLDRTWGALTRESIGDHVKLLGSLNRGRREATAAQHELRLDLVEPGILSLLGELERSRVPASGRPVILDWAGGLLNHHAEDRESPQPQDPAQDSREASGKNLIL